VPVEEAPRCVDVVVQAENLCGQCRDLAPLLQLGPDDSRLLGSVSEVLALISLPHMMEGLAVCIRRHSPFGAEAALVVDQEASLWAPVLAEVSQRSV